MKTTPVLIAVALCAPLLMGCAGTSLFSSSTNQVPTETGQPPTTPGETAVNQPSIDPATARGIASDLFREGLKDYENASFAEARSEFDNGFNLLLASGVKSWDDAVILADSLVQGAGQGLLVSQVCSELYQLDMDEAEGDSAGDRLTAMEETGVVSDSEEVKITEESKKLDINAEFWKVMHNFGVPATYKIPSQFINRVKYYVKLFTTDPLKRGFYERSLARREKYADMVRSIFAEHGFPEEMDYVAFVESGFNPVSLSRAGARGMWQFMPATARDYNLKVTRNKDDRLDAVKATRAAADYFNRLLIQFGDGHSFLLAIAAYNAGEGRIQREINALKDYRQRTFWGLIENGNLRQETEEYVPQIIAAAIIGKNPTQFGFGPSHNSAQVDRLWVDRSVPLDLICKSAGITREKLRSLNPDLSASSLVTPGDQASYLIALPAGTGKQVSATLGLVPRSVNVCKEEEDTPPTTIAQKTSKSKNKGSYIYYNAQKGNTVPEVATWFGVTESKLKSWNRYLGQRSLRPGDKVFIADLPSNFVRTVTKVRPHETLSGIARKYDVPIEALAGWNGLKGTKINVGQKLVVYKLTVGTKEVVVAEKSSPKPVEVKDNAPVKESLVTYQVQPGNDLPGIAKFFKVSEDGLMKANDLRAKNLAPGQKLTIPTGQRSRLVHHVVQKGETLIGIGRKFGLTLAEITFVNGRTPDYRVKVGEVVTVYTN